MRVPHPIPYQGSKRRLAPLILSFFPKDVKVLIEPFAGSAAVGLAAAMKRKAKRILLNDINRSLMRLWEDIIFRPEEIAEEYKVLWKQQRGRERKYYDIVREQFNKTGRPDCFLYLLARCVKASVRYNSNGEFNQSPDNRRKGTHPETMRRQIIAASEILRGKTKLMCGDHREPLTGATVDDLVYLDPPYQGVCGGRDSRYVKGLAFDGFVDSLDGLNERQISYIVSYDGRMGAKSYGRKLPDRLDLKHIEVPAGRSTQATLLGRNHVTYESIYLSYALISRLEEHSAGAIIRRRQLNLFGAHV